MLFKQFPNHYFHSWVLYLFFSIAMVYDVVGMEGVFVEPILEVCLFLNNFELWQCLRIQISLQIFFIALVFLMYFVMITVVWRIMNIHPSQFVLQDLKQGKVLNTW